MKRKHPILIEQSFMNLIATVAEHMGEEFAFHRHLEPLPPEIQIVPIPLPMFRKLLTLCHPDKHGNSKLSQEVTVWLNVERDKLKTNG